jgi:hypothetical protein
MSDAVYLDNYAADLTKYPNDTIELADNTEITIGDLHANTMKLIYFLLRYRVILLDENLEKAQALYQELYESYKIAASQTLSQGKFRAFMNIINNIHISKERKIMIRLLGDEFADRGSNDLFTMGLMGQIFDFVQQHPEQLQLKIIVSNHSLEALQMYFFCFAILLKNRAELCPPAMQVFLDKTCSPQQVSFCGIAQECYMHSYGVVPQYFEVFFQVYCRNLLVLDYTFTHDAKLIVYSHAPVDVSDIKVLSAKLGIVVPVSVEVSSMVTWIDEINKEFQKRLWQGG